MKKAKGGYPNAYLRFREQRAAAKRRGIDWKFEFWEWMQIWEESGHFHERGKCKGQYCMSRNNDEGAYEASNVKIVRNETNIGWSANKRWPNRRKVSECDISIRASQLPESCLSESVTSATDCRGC